MTPTPQAVALVALMRASRHPNVAYGVVRAFAESTREAPDAYVLDVVLHSAPGTRDMVREAAEDLAGAIAQVHADAPVRLLVIDDPASPAPILRIIRHRFAPTQKPHP